MEEPEKECIKIVIAVVAFIILAFIIALSV